MKTVLIQAARCFLATENDMYKYFLLLILMVIWKFKEANIKME